MSTSLNGTSHAGRGRANATKPSLQPVAQQASLDPQLNDFAAAKASKAADRREVNKWAMTEALAPYFDRAVTLRCAAANQPAKWYADRISVDESTLSLMRKGKRLIGPEHVAPCLEAPPAAAEIARGIMAPSGGDVRLLRRQAVTWERARTWIVEWVLGDERTRNHALRDIAEEKGVERSELEDAINEHDEEEPAEERAPFQHQGATP